ncbi:MAG: hypothetical protein ACRDFS_10790, partial [Chloroflexota bacterium]
MAGVNPVIVAYLIIEGIIVTAAVLGERHAYRQRLKMTEGHWEKTKERFKDPATGKLVDVYYNP